MISNVDQIKTIQMNRTNNSRITAPFSGFVSLVVNKRSIFHPWESMADTETEMWWSNALSSSKDTCRTDWKIPPGKWLLITRKYSFRHEKEEKWLWFALTGGKTMIRGEYGMNRATNGNHLAIVWHWQIRWIIPMKSIRVKKTSEALSYR